MPKKKEVEVSNPAKAKGAISEITADFGRADLNELAAKLNEVIRAVNK